MSLTVPEILDSSKKAFIEGKNLIMRVINTEEGMRNTTHLSKEYLEKIVKLAIMNSLMATKLGMFGD